MYKIYRRGGPGGGPKNRSLGRTRQIFENFIIHEPSLGSHGVTQKNLTFDVYWKQTNKQTNKQTDKPNLYIDCILYCLKHF